MWIIISAIIIPPFGLLLLNMLNRRRKPTLSAPLVEELRQGLPQYEVEGIEGKDSGLIVMKHAFGTWFIHAIELSRRATLYILKAPEYTDDKGVVVYPGATIKRVVDSRKDTAPAWSAPTSNRAGDRCSTFTRHHGCSDFGAIRRSRSTRLRRALTRSGSS